MVRFGGAELERPPLSAILPRLYLGAESDVTQECLSSLDISYVLSVSRCSPRPSFLPFSRFLRVPIDDSLSDDLLPWLPQALLFIDDALSSGASVLVHCAAGISRSPALTVAYIMHRLGLDLDHAYRFVKERRPSISPNLNFLGQLQHYQATLKLGPAPCVAPGAPAEPVLTSSVHEEKQAATAGLPTAEAPTAGAPTAEAPTAGAPTAGAPTAVAPTEIPVDPPTTLRLPKSLSLNLRGHNQDSQKTLSEKRQSLTLSLTPLNLSPPCAAPAPLSSGTGPAHTERGPQHTHRGSHSGQHTHRGTHSGQRTQQQQPHSCPRAEHKEALLSPLSVTLNRLLSWGERVLLATPVRMGQPALPYSC